MKNYGAFEWSPTVNGVSTCTWPGVELSHRTGTVARGGKVLTGNGAKLRALENGEWSVQTNAGDVCTFYTQVKGNDLQGAKLRAQAAAMALNKLREI